MQRQQMTEEEFRAHYAAQGCDEFRDDVQWGGTEAYANGELAATLHFDGTVTQWY
jgi:hypothetical protein